MKLKTHGDEELRTGVAGVKRALKNEYQPEPDEVDEYENYSMVWGNSCYIIRDGKGRSYTLTVLWWDNGVEKTKEFKYADREKAIKFFLSIVKKIKSGEIDISEEEEEPVERQIHPNKRKQ